MKDLLKPISVLLGTVVVYFILQKFDKKKDVNKSKLKDILTKVSLFLIIFIIFVTLIYWFDILSFVPMLKGKKTDINVKIDGGDISKTLNDTAELETIKRIRENIHVGLIPDNMTIGEISRK